MSTLPDVFIIESLSPDDEGNGRFEGGIISQMLRLHGKEPKYRYVRTRKEFIEAVEQFGESKYRYLHISAHADEDGMCVTNQEEIDFDELSEILRPYLKGRRLFLSACSMVHDELAEEMIPNSGCFSVVGPTEDIRFSDAAIVWSSIYHLLFTDNTDSINHAGLKKRLLKVCALFQVKLGYYSKSKKLERGYTRDFLKA